MVSSAWRFLTNWGGSGMPTSEPDQQDFRFVLLVRRSGKQQQVLIRISDNESFGSPRFPFQSLLKWNIGGLKLKKQQLDLVRCGDGHRCRQSLTIAGRRIDYGLLDTPK